jgi:hypothetical protein
MPRVIAARRNQRRVRDGQARRPVLDVPAPVAPE